MPSRSRVDAVRHISQPRLGRYLDDVDADLDLALDLYEWNMQACGAFFESIAGLEIALRNRMHEQLSLWCVDDASHWYEDPKGVFNDASKRSIATARRNVAKRGADETPGRVVSEISFGFWRFLLTGSYQSTLWVPCLRYVFPNVKRKDVEDEIATIHVLRNRIAHHEAIYHRDLQADYDSLIGLAEHLHPRLGWWIDARSRVPSVLRERPAAIVSAA